LSDDRQNHRLRKFPVFLHSLQYNFESYVETDRNACTVSFNGDHQALHVADIALIGGDSVILAILSDVFFYKGKEGVFEIIRNWALEKIHSQNLEAYRPLINQLFSREMGSFPRIELITDSNREHLIDESESFRQIIFQDQR